MKDQAMNSKRILWKLAVSAYFIAASFSIGATESSQFVVTTSSYSAASSEQHAVLNWLQQNAGYVNGKVIGDFGSIGSVTVTYSREVVAYDQVIPMSPGGGPPTPLPSGGKPGDTYSVSSCSAGVSQTWSYQWMSSSTGGGWVLVSYTYNQNACASGGA
jgi:hypothetical protein